MKVAVIGSRNLQVHDLSVYLPSNTTVLISGGAKGIDTCAECYAEKNNIPFIKICPAYEKYGRVALKDGRPVPLMWLLFVAFCIQNIISTDIQHPCC